MSLTNIGTVMYISATLPTAETKAGYEALSWIEITDVSAVPATGPSASLLTFTPLKDGIVRKAHGEVNYGSGSLAFRKKSGDAGQTALRTAFDGQDEVAFKIVRPSGVYEYFIGIVMGYQTPEANAGNTNIANSTIEVSSKVLETTAPTP